MAQRIIGDSVRLPSGDVVEGYALYDEADGTITLRCGREVYEKIRQLGHPRMYSVAMEEDQFIVHLSGLDQSTGGYAVVASQTVPTGAVAGEWGVVGPDGLAIRLVPAAGLTLERVEIGTPGSTTLLTVDETNGVLVDGTDAVLTEADASTTPTANLIPVADALGKIDSGWITFPASGASGLDAIDDTQGFWHTAGSKRGAVSQAGGLGCAADTIFYVPFLTSRGGTIGAVGLSQVGGVAPDKVRVGLYNAISASNPRPGTQVTEWGVIDISGAAGWKQLTGLSTPVVAGQLYFLAVLANAAFDPNATPLTDAICLGRDPTVDIRDGVTQFTEAQAYGALPATASATPTAVVTAPRPNISVKFSA